MPILSIVILTYIDNNTKRKSKINIIILTTIAARLDILSLLFSLHDKNQNHNTKKQNSKTVRKIALNFPAS